MNFGNISLRPDDNKLAILWLAGGVMSLALAGIYSIILLLLRAPLIINLFSNTELFKTALVVHANLSILIWLLSVTASIWSYNLKPTYFTIACVILGFIGMVLIALSPLCGQKFPVMNNHIPMLENIIFVLGLSSFGVAILLFAIYVLWQYLLIKVDNNQNDDQLIRITIFSSSVVLLLVWGCFIASYWQLHEVIKLVPVDIELYYELLFWSGGHLLQFLYTQILIYVWLSLLQVWIGKELRFKKFYLALLYLNLLIAITSILGHLLYDIVDSDFKEYYTKQVRYGCTIAPVLSLIIMFYEVIINKNNLKQHFAKVIIICSSVLFLFGEVITMSISITNVTIPVHYHDSVNAISIAFMGFAYLLCNNKVKSSYFTMAIITITIGQMLHIMAILLAGGYGVAGKILGIAIDFSNKLLMVTMGGGSLIEVVGGLMFVVICGKQMLILIK